MGKEDGGENRIVVEKVAFGQDGEPVVGVEQRCVPTEVDGLAADFAGFAVQVVMREPDSMDAYLLDDGRVNLEKLNEDSTPTDVLYWCVYNRLILFESAEVEVVMAKIFTHPNMDLELVKWMRREFGDKFAAMALDLPEEVRMLEDVFREVFADLLEDEMSEGAIPEGDSYDLWLTFGRYLAFYNCD